MSGGAKVGIAVVILVMVGAGVAFAVNRSGDRGVEVRTEEVRERELISTITATGSIRARRQVNISSDVMGRVIQLNVEEGDEVQRGDLLLRIDPSQPQAALSRARAALSQAEAQVSQQRASLLQAHRETDRLRDLRARNPDLVSTQALEEVETRVEVERSLLSSAQHAVEQAQAGVDEAVENLSRTTISAPIAGRVIRLNIEEGETVVVGTMNNPGSLLLTIGDLSGVEAVLRVDETDVPQISLGDSALVELDAFPGQRFAARVATVGNSAIQGASGASAPGGGSQSTVDYEVVLTLLDPPPTLRPDLSATADIIVDRRERAVAVPIISVTTREEGGEADGAARTDSDTVEGARRGLLARDAGPRRVEGVFLVREGRAVWQPVQIGITGQEYFEIVSGVSPADSVVSGPFQEIQNLQDGDAVRIQERSPGSR
jgi:HlyD family secretion protein